MTGLHIPVEVLNLIRAVMGIHNRRFNLFVKCSRLAVLGIPPLARLTAAVLSPPGTAAFFFAHRAWLSPIRETVDCMLLVICFGSPDSAPRQISMAAAL